MGRRVFFVPGLECKLTIVVFDFIYFAADITEVDSISRRLLEARLGTG